MTDSIAKNSHKLIVYMILHYFVILSAQAVSQLCFMFTAGPGSVISLDSARPVLPRATPMSNQLPNQYHAYI